MHWLAHFLGLDAASGYPYLFWSGAGSDITELAVIGALIGLLRRHNCEARRCWRLGRHATAAGHRVCARHMPGGAPTRHHIIQAHRRALSGTDGERLAAGTETRHPDGDGT